MVMNLDHVAIAVRNLEETVELYKKMGFSVERVERVEEQGVKVAFLSLENTHLEIIEPMDENSPVGKFLEKRGEGLHHIAISVSNLNEKMEELKSKGFIVVGSGKGACGKNVFFVHPKSAKILLEFVEG